MATTADIAIVGGGVIGLTAAYVLAKEGQHVTLVDRQDFGQEASWAGAGIIPPGNPDKAVSPFDQLRSHSSARFPALSQELLEATGVDNGYQKCGGLEFILEEHAGQPEEWRGAGIRLQALSQAETGRLEPGLAPNLGRACLLPDMAQLRNPRHLQALVAGCAKLHVELRPNCAATELVSERSRGAAVRCERETINAGAILLAAGAWTDPLLASLGCELDIQPVRGQIALLNSPTPLVRHVLLWGDSYLVPRQDDRVLIGSTEEYAGFDNRTTAVAQRDLVDLACRL